jgi:phage baseplate assembly protein W
MATSGNAFRSGAKNAPINEIVFKDLPLNFLAHPITKKINPLKNEDAIKRAVKNLILTNYYERPYNSFFGGNIIAQLFENFSPITRVSVEKAIKDAIDVYEPRVKFINAYVQANDDKNELIITIVFKIINQVDETELVFTVERIR